VRIVSAPETEATGFAGRVGEVWSESKRPGSGIGPVIGDRGDRLAFSVLFESTEDVVWFAPHLLRRVGRPGFPSRRLPFVFFAALAIAALTAVAGLTTGTVRRLTVISAVTPCLPVHGYLTTGTYPNVLGASKGAARTNIALRRAVVADQQGYAPSAQQHRVPNGSGVYRTAVDQQLTSASTVVVSALIPTLKLYPDRSGSQTWISATIDVLSGRPVSLRQLLANPPLALAALAASWRARSRAVLPPAVAQDAADYTPTFAHYRYFALTPAGLAFGFPAGAAGSRFAAVIPYRIVRPYLSPLGRRLVAGVRRSRPVPRRDQHQFVWASLKHTPMDPAANLPIACT
jgi:hypothetical protein